MGNAKLLEEEKQKREKVEMQLESYKMAAAFATRNSNDLRAQYESVQSALVSVEDEFRTFRQNAGQSEKVALDKNDELTTEMKSLSDELMRAKEEANTYKEKTMNLVKDNRGFLRTLQSKDNELNKLQHDSESSRNQTFACEEEIIELKEHIERQTVDSSNDSIKLLSLKSDLVEQQQRSRGLVSQISDLRTELISCSEREIQLKEQVIKFKEESEAIPSFEAEIAELRKKLEETKVSFSSLSSSSNHSRSQLAAAQIEIIELKSKLNESDASLSKYAANTTSASQNFADLESHVCELKQNLAVAESAASLQSDKFTKKLALKSNEVNDRNQQIMELKARNKTLTIELSERSKEIVVKDSVEMQRDLLEKERDDLLANNVELEGKVVAFEERSRSLSSKLGEVNARSRDEETLVSELRQQIERLRNDNDQLFSDNEDILIELGYQKQLQDTQREEFVAATAQFEQRLQNDIDTRKIEKESAIEAESSLRSDLSKLAEENESLKCEIKSLLVEKNRGTIEKAQCNGLSDQDYASKIQELNSSLHDKQNIISKLEGRLNLSQCELIEKDKEFKNAIMKFENLTASNSEQNRKDDGVLSQLRAESQELKQSLELATRELQAKENKISALNQRLDADREQPESSYRDVFSSPFLKGLRNDNTSPEILNKHVIHLISALERSELQRADCLDRLVSERKNHAESLKKLGDSVKRFYSTLSYGDGAS